VQHRTVDVPGGRIHLVEAGEGPLVLMVHGFPEGWYSWRHQLAALAAHTGLLRPDVVTAVALLGVPYTPPGGPRPTDVFAQAGGDEEFYVSYFQAPGRAEAEIEADVRGWLAGFYAGLSGDTPLDPSLFSVPRGGRMRDRFPAGDALPGWLTAADLDVYAGEFERTGAAGALNRYRNVDRDWEDLAAWDGTPLQRPALFIGGERDATTIWMAQAIEHQRETVPGLVASHVLEGCGHWIQQERPDEVNRLLVEWLRGVGDSAPR
jgi:pimeloyl-ACP methyl ester carboxylesterase